MATFVLVHGGFTGGWLWGKVRPLLNAAGHETFTPTLTGIGERRHLANPNVDLATHVRDIVNVISYENLASVTLVGHSSSSMVVTGVVEEVPERIGKLVYLDTLVPEDGQCWADLLGPEIWSYIAEIIRTTGDGWNIPLFADNPRLSPHPAKAVTDAISISNPAARLVPRAYIHCTAKPPEWFFGLLGPIVDRAAAELKSAGWEYREIPTGHEPMQTMPAEFVEALLSLR